MNLGTLAGGLGCSPLDDEAYPPPSDSRAAGDGIQSFVGFGNVGTPLVHRVLYPRRGSREASPKAISERTSNYGI